MRCILSAEVEKWLTDNLYQVESERAKVRPASRFESISIDIPRESSRQAVLSNLIARLVEQASESLIWITAWGIGPSEENWPLFTGLRLLHGERRKLIEAPGHLFRSEESEALASLIRLVLAFGWDAHVATNGGELLVSLSHEEIAEFRSCSSRMSEVLAMNLKQNDFISLAGATGRV